MSYGLKGGGSGQESIGNGVYNLKGEWSPDDNIIIHDGLEPLVNNFAIDGILEKCNEYENDVTSLLCSEQIFVDGEASTVKYS